MLHVLSLCSSHLSSWPTQWVGSASSYGDEQDGCSSATPQYLQKHEGREGSPDAALGNRVTGPLGSQSLANGRESVLIVLDQP